ncbi:IQ motif and SEC7 domain-containing protein 3 [Gopherus evgoodei]|uniref:IQ motif and SEC7 domain-containing protein 3 n=1 Tax=Gopherus evgoodei TaxID=1825980 RepID=UPI0011CFB666|nr:IQ motif and SEC7 domain-containing protein 3 [Gopherus evgoodei]
MESLLENPVRAVLYLKELTAIVQNQQSLIHTQRQRIDELERRLDELSAENRSLRQQHPAPAAELQPRPPAPPAPAPEPLQHPQQLPAPQPLQGRQAQQGPSGGSSSSRAPAHQHPPLQPHQHPPEKDSRERGCCTTLLQHKPAPAIGKGALSRRPE